MHKDFHWTMTSLTKSSFPHYRKYYKFERKNIKKESAKEDKKLIISRRSSRREVFSKKGVLKNFTKLTGKHLCQSLFFNKVADLRPATLLKDTLAQVFSCESYDISKGKDTLFQGHFMKHEILSWNAFTLVSSIHCVCFSSIKKIVFTEKRFIKSCKI